MAVDRSGRFHDFGGSGLVRFEERARRTAGADQVLVGVHATSLDPVDGGSLRGGFPVVAGQAFHRARPGHHGARL